MARKPGGLSLPGFLRIASRRWERHLTIHRGGASAQGLSELHLTGKAPGGFKMQIVQVDDFLLAQWHMAGLRYLEQKSSWTTTKEMMAEAQRILKDLEASAKSTS